MSWIIYGGTIRCAGRLRLLHPRQVIPTPPIRTALVPAMRLPVPVTRPVVVPLFAVLTPDTPHDHSVVVRDRLLRVASRLSIAIA